MRLALETPSVMDAVLGFSAFHLRYINKLDRGVQRLTHIHDPSHLTTREEYPLWDNA